MSGSRLVETFSAPAGSGRPYESRAYPFDLEATMPYPGDWLPVLGRFCLEQVGWRDDGRFAIMTEDGDGALYETLLTPPPVKAPRPVRVVTEQQVKAYISPEDRAARQDGRQCRNGHDLDGTLPNGRPARYVSPKGEVSCRHCKQAAATRCAEKRETR